MYDITALYEAESVSHTIRLLQEHPEARIIAGGSDVLIQIREGRLAGCELVSIHKLEALKGISLDSDETIRIGPLTTFAQIAKDSLIQTHISVLGEAADQVGGPQIRNVGTIGGNICNGLSSADTASTLIAWDALLEYTGCTGVRLTPISKHYVSAGKTALAHDELLTAVFIPKKSYTQYYGHYIKYAMRNAMDIATLGCSANVRLTPDKQYFEAVRIGYGLAGPTPIRVARAEKAAQGKPVTMETIEEIGKAALAEVNPRSSWRASRELRLHITEELTKRGVRQAVKNAGGIV
jgi:xanthine dehydrogenase FAD-binding subunit